MRNYTVKSNLQVTFVNDLETIAQLLVPHRKRITIRMHKVSRRSRRTRVCGSVRLPYNNLLITHS